MKKLRKVAQTSPSSNKAVANGCLCSVVDNCYGRGWAFATKPGEYMINGMCPLHGGASEKNSS
jgi:hypothetical protein